MQIPGVLVDCVVVAEPENHRQTYATAYNPAFSGRQRVPLDRIDAAAARRAQDHRAPVRVRAAARRRGQSRHRHAGGRGGGRRRGEGAQILTLTAEPGVIGGLPQGGLDFGAALNPGAVIHQNQQFDFYDGGGLDLACLGLAQVDARGQRQRQPVRAQARGRGRLHQHQPERPQGGVRRHVHGRRAGDRGRGRAAAHRAARASRASSSTAVEQITFSGAYAAETGQPVFYVTERCVFRRTPAGMELIEVAPGIDVERDILAQMGFKPIVKDPKPMDARLFGEP